jgi:myo-inositol 2-dehydrogenase/D-chiro-inositol 1-dehydrogenase
MQTRPIGLAVFGAGRIGSVHARNAASLPSAKLIGVADIDRVAAQRVVNACKAGRVDDAEAFLRDPGVDAIVVATPTDSHAQLVLAAAAVKKHVFCEKPISLDLETTKSVIAAAQRAGIALQVGFQRRFDGDFQRARQMVASGEIGSVRFMRLVSRDHHIAPISYLRTSGGQFIDQMIHDFDAAAWLCAPARVAQVFAAGAAMIEPALHEFGDADTTVAVLRFDTGALAVIDGSREAAYGYDVRGEIVGANGMLLFGHRQLPSGPLLDTRAASSDSQSFIEYFAAAYREELADFAAALAAGRPPRVGGEDALTALQLAVAATRSFRENRPVALAEIGS